MCPQVSACSGFPAEEADSEEESGNPPGGYYQDVGPVERGAEEPGLHAGEEMPDREDSADPEHQAGGLFPSGMKIPDRNSSSGRMTALTIGSEATAFGMTAEIANPSAQNALHG